MLGLGLALASSLSWGVADFIGGVQSRRLPVLRVVLVSQAAGLVVIALILAVRGVGAPALWRLVPAGGAGLAGAAGLAAFYRGLATGSMSIVAPIAATGVAIPVVVGIVGGDRPGVAQVLGIAAAVVGVVLVSREEGPARPGTDGRPAAPSGRGVRSSVGLALASAVGFGTFFLGLHASASADALWATLAARVSSVAALALVALSWRDAVRMAGRGAGSPVNWLALAAVGTLDVGANALYAVATRHGLLSVVSVLSSLYPLATVALARVILGERVRRVQEVGIVAAVTGVLLIAAG